VNGNEKDKENNATEKWKQQQKNWKGYTKIWMKKDMHKHTSKTLINVCYFKFAAGNTKITVHYNKLQTISFKVLVENSWPFFFSGEWRGLFSCKKNKDTLVLNIRF
jgi:hypothetical protein